jgi:hypothetical protein
MEKGIRKVYFALISDFKVLSLFFHDFVSLGYQFFFSRFGAQKVAGSDPPAAVFFVLLNIVFYHRASTCHAFTFIFFVKTSNFISKNTILVCLLPVSDSVISRL